MIEIICGVKGKGKTKELLGKVNAAIQTANGNVVYLDKSQKHMYELNNKVRLINVADYCITNSDEFVGFLLGIISQDHDLEQIYLDSFLEITCLEGGNISSTISKLEQIGGKYTIDFVLSISVDEAEVSEELKSKVIVAL